MFNQSVLASVLVCMSSAGAATLRRAEGSLCGWHGVGAPDNSGGQKELGSLPPLMGLNDHPLHSFNNRAELVLVAQSHQVV